MLKEKKISQTYEQESQTEVFTGPPGADHESRGMGGLFPVLGTVSSFQFLPPIGNVSPL